MWWRALWCVRVWCVVAVAVVVAVVAAVAARGGCRAVLAVLAVMAASSPQPTATEISTSRELSGAGGGSEV